MRKVTEEGRKQTAKERRRAAAASGDVGRAAAGHKMKHSLSSPITEKYSRETKRGGTIG